METAILGLFVYAICRIADSTVLCFRPKSAKNPQVGDKSMQLCPAWQTNEAGKSIPMLILAVA
jgi:hypothetical protein